MLPKTAEYALRAVVWLAREPDETASADHLAENTKVPRRYLHKVLQDLVRAKLVRSQSGPGGGYANSQLPAWLTVAHEALSAAQGTRQRVRRVGKSTLSRDDFPARRFDQSHYSLV
jgi:Rrf2 family protein